MQREPNRVEQRVLDAEDVSTRGDAFDAETTLMIGARDQIGRVDANGRAGERASPQTIEYDADCR